MKFFVLSMIMVFSAISCTKTRTNEREVGLSGNQKIIVKTKSKWKVNYLQWEGGAETRLDQVTFLIWITGNKKQDVSKLFSEAIFRSFPELGLPGENWGNGDPLGFRVFRAIKVLEDKWLLECPFQNRRHFMLLGRDHAELLPVSVLPEPFSKNHFILNGNIVTLTDYETKEVTKIDLSEF